MLFWAVVLGWNAIVCGALVWLWLSLRDAVKTTARILEIHTTALRRHETQLSERAWPRYTDAVLPLPARPVSDWKGHDDRVTQALAQRLPAAPWKASDAPRGLGLPSPEHAPFFTESAPSE